MSTGSTDPATSRLSYSCGPSTRPRRTDSGIGTTLRRFPNGTGRLHGQPPRRPAGAPLAPDLQGVEFDEVRFRYPGDKREILRGISFEAEPGQTVAILDTTGSGKSTLVNLIPRFYNVSGGRCSSTAMTFAT